jgi:hypothetical protein
MDQPHVVSFHMKRNCNIAGSFSPVALGRAATLYTFPSTLIAPGFARCDFVYQPLSCILNTEINKPHFICPRSHLSHAFGRCLVRARAEALSQGLPLGA